MIDRLQLLTVWLALLAANAIWASFTGGWTSCWERSFFQGIAVLAVWMSQGGRQP